MKHIIFALVSLALIALCGCGGSGGGSGTLFITSISIDQPLNAAFIPGAVIHFSATAKSGQIIVPNAQFTWSVTPSIIGTFNQNGDLTISRTLTADVSGTVNVSVGSVSATFAIGVKAFPGNWVGTQMFIPPIGIEQDAGFLTIGIDTNGLISGAISRTTVGDSAPIHGTIGSDGTLTLSWQFAGENSRTANGKVAITPGGKLEPLSGAGSLIVSSGGVEVGELEFSLTREFGL